jgi:tetratricopeptide (TPR) repeat protein
MGIVGNLQTMQLEELLQWLSQSKKTGTLEIKDGSLEKKIFFKDGRILSSASNKPEEYLGNFLVSHGLITEDQLTRAMEHQAKSRMMLGMILMNAGAISEEMLRRMLRLKAEEAIYDIFSWSAGEFQFLDDMLPESSMVPLSLDVTGIVMEGVQRVDEWRRIRALIPDGDAIPVQIAEYNFKHLDQGEKRILELVDDQRSVEDIRLSTHSAEFHVCRVLFGQHQQGRLKIVRPKARGGAGGRSNGPVAISGEALLQAGQAYLEKGEYEQALRHMRAAHSLEPEDRDLSDAVAQGEKKIREVLERAGVFLTSIPKLTATMEQITSSKLSPHEGFMLTRINGSYDIQSVLKITPMPQLDALLIFWKLSQQGFVRLDLGRR